MTKYEFFNAISEIEEIKNNEDFMTIINKEIEKIVKKRSYVSPKEAEKRKENIEVIQSALIDIIGNAELISAKGCVLALEANGIGKYSIPRVVANINALIKDGYIERVYEKTNAFYKLVKD